MLGLYSTLLLPHSALIKEKAADIFVCCSISESGPMSVFEAMAIENPIVTTDIGDVRKLFKNNQAGLIVPVNEADKMAEEVVALINNPARRAELGKQARTIAKRQLDVSCCVDAHKEAYEAAAKLMV